jgi:hypothetical protein
MATFKVDDADRAEVEEVLQQIGIMYEVDGER